MELAEEREIRGGGPRAEEEGVAGLEVFLEATQEPDEGLLDYRARDLVAPDHLPKPLDLTVGHGLPEGFHGLESSLEAEGGADGEPPWREDDEIEDISVEGEWEGGSPDAEWGENLPSSAEEEADEA